MPRPQRQRARSGTNSSCTNVVAPPNTDAQVARAALKACAEQRAARPCEPTSKFGQVWGTSANSKRNTLREHLRRLSS
eukprot:14828696-Alexandrium_andersonii.AAC.1